jgi:hypothetical protein
MPIIPATQKEEIEELQSQASPSLEKKQAENGSADL